MNKLNYTHYAKYKGIPCYFNVETDGLTGRNWFWSLILDAVIYIESHFATSSHFEIELGEELEENNLAH